GGRVSAGGATRLLAARDGWCAITLSRPDDVAAVPALLQVDEVPLDPWPMLRDWAAASRASAITERAELLDIPAAVLGETAAAPPRIRRIGARTPVPGLAGLLVADLSSMWAGPLCGQLLARAGATVVKVESPRRPDGTRGGDRAFFDWINGEKLSYYVEFDSQADELRELLAVSDIVIEGSRPTALARRRLGPGDVAPRTGRIWLRITGYDDTRPAFGDDAAVAGGLVGAAVDGPVFCGDAIADPLTGLEATLAVVESLDRGGGELVHVSMAGVAATYAALPTAASMSECPAPPPQAPPASSPAPGPGADNGTVRRTVVERGCLSC
ncbi:MAG TPA: CoA transferase, partial [Mycobacterium sp.]|nr:CoA transferase [Mycobacterium sp.]